MNMINSSRGIQFSAGKNLVRKLGTSIKLLEVTQPVLNSSLVHLEHTERRLSVRSGPKHLNLNIGGTPYRLYLSNVLKRGETGLLYKFFTCTHEARLDLCDDYIESSEEYYFERPSKFFDPVYTYYTTGICYRPNRNMLIVFFAELSFWGLTKVFFPEIHNEAVRAEENLFQKLPWGDVRRKIWNLLEIPSSSRMAKILALVSVFAVLLSNVCLILGSMELFQITQKSDMAISSNRTIDDKFIEFERPHPILQYIETVCMVYFTVEYLTKILIAHDRKTVMLEFMSIVDLVVILPFYFELTLGICGFDAAEIPRFQGLLLLMRIIRISRIIRLLKLGRHSSGLKLCAKVMERSMGQFVMVAVSGAVAMVFFSTLTYSAEKDVPNTSFTSIPATFWWSIVTMTTVGYGDMCPATTVGKLCASATIIAGVLICALPITVMVDNFVNIKEEFNQTQGIKRHGRRHETARATNNNI